jgi:hypothetical protein
MENNTTIINKEQSIEQTIHLVLSDLSKIGVGKTQINEFSKYKYRGIDNILNTISSILATHGLIIMPIAMHDKTTEIVVIKDKHSESVHANIEYRFTHIHNKDATTAIIAAQSRDTSDKAASQMMSMAYKYMAIQVFAIPIVGDDDGDSKTPTIAAKVNADKLQIDDKIMPTATTEKLMTLEQRQALQILLDNDEITNKHKDQIKIVLDNPSYPASKAKLIIDKLNEVYSK